MRHITMDHTGDTVQEFDKLDPAQLAEARAQFDKLLGAGFSAACRSEGKSELVRSFDPDREETLFIQPLQGG